MMAIRIGINGFGRIGRLVCKSGYGQRALEFAAVNELADTKTPARLLKYDSVHGASLAEIKADDHSIPVCSATRPRVFSETPPANMPLRSLGLDLVVQLSSKFMEPQHFAKPMAARTKGVSSSTRRKRVSDTVLMGVTVWLDNEFGHTAFGGGLPAPGGVSAKCTSGTVFRRDPIGKTATPVAIISRNVFIAHGADREPALELACILQTRWHLKPVLLELEPGKSLPLIQKFERAAAGASYAFVLFTPDDLVQGEDGKYRQARPNAFFEAGWLFAHLTPERVCLLVKQGARIPTDLEGVTRIGFHDSVLEKVVQIEKELRAAGSIGRKNRARSA